MATQPTPSERLLTPAEVAALVFVHPKTVSRWARAGKIPSQRTPGGHRRFRSSDVQALMPKNWSQGRLRDESLRPLLDDGSVERGGTAATREIDRVAAGAVVAEAVAIALEAQAEAAAEAVVETAASVAIAAATAAAAAVKAREARALAAAEAARVTAGEAASAAAAMRSRATVQAGYLAEAAEQARRLVSASDPEAQNTFAAVRMAATVQAAADAASADTVLAAARVAQAVVDAAANIAVMVAAFDLSLERETAVTAEALHSLTVETARRVDQRNGVVARRASSVRTLRA
jgi:excisionase family DNA binding protein